MPATSIDCRSGGCLVARPHAFPKRDSGGRSRPLADHVLGTEATIGNRLAEHDNGRFDTPDPAEFEFWWGVAGELVRIYLRNDIGISVLNTASKTPSAGRSVFDNRPD